MATPTGSKYTNTITNTHFQEHAVLWKDGKTKRVFDIVSGWGNWNASLLSRGPTEFYVRNMINCVIGVEWEKNLREGNSL